jgi:hypothetical protein
MSDYLLKEASAVNTSEVDEETTDDNLIEEPVTNG